MGDQWSSTGLDLYLQPIPAKHKRESLERALRDAVREGRLTPGSPLPSSRALARDLGLARGTITQAYDQLIAEGYLLSQPRSVVRVAFQPAGLLTGTSAPATSTPRPVPQFDLRPGLPDLSSFPRREWLKATQHVLQTTPNSAFGYGEQTGCAELRQSLADYLGRVRGVVTSADQIIVCTGYTHALRLICEVLVQQGTPTIAFEEPSLPDYPNLAAQVGLDVGYLPVDRDGAVVEELGGEAAVVVTPAHQFPLGVPLSPSRRTQLLGWAHRSRGLVVEDDYDGEFRYDRQPVAALQGMAPSQVIYVGTTSKSVAPALRLAWIVVPADLVDTFRETTRWDEAYVNMIDQLVLARLIQTGAFDRHLRRRRAQYRNRRDRLGAAITQHLPNGNLSGVAAGLHAVLQLNADTGTETQILGRLERNGVAVHSLTRFYHREADTPLGLVIGYATPPDHAYDNALSTLINVLRANHQASTPTH